MKNKSEHPVSFFLLVFLLSVPFWILDTIFPIELLPGLPLSALAVLVPALAASILVYRDNHFTGVVRLLRRALDFKRTKKTYWFLIVILINPLIAVLAFGIIRAIGISIPNPGLLPTATFLLFSVFFISALAEEIGWTGYVTEPLMKRWGTTTASILLGIVWSVWHFIPLLQAHRSVGWIAWWSVWTISLRIIMGWLYIRSGGSLFVASLFHAMINLCWQLFPVNGSFFNPQIFGLITFVIAIAVLLIEQFRMKNSGQALQSS